MSIMALFPVTTNTEGDHGIQNIVKKRNREANIILWSGFKENLQNYLVVICRGRCIPVMEIEKRKRQRRFP